jgi:hypothetical protein
MKADTAQAPQGFNFIRLDGTTFSARYAPFITGVRMDAMVKQLRHYTDIAFRIDETLGALTISPELLDSDESMRAAKPLLKEYLSETGDKEKIRKSLIKLFGGKLTDEEETVNMLCHRKFIQIMVLETVLSEEDLALVKSDVTSEFWGNQDAFAVKSAGESFRKTVLKFTE